MRAFSGRGVCLAIWLTLCAASAAALDKPLFATGQAVAVASGELLYIERHFCEPERLHCSVEYSDTQGEVFAVKALDYTRGRFAPGVRLEDLRNSQVLSLTAGSTEADEVIDAGFDNYVRSRWDALATGDAVLFDFQPLGMDRSIRMRAELRGEAECAEEHLCLEVKVNSWFIGLLTQPLALTYERSSRRLLRYVGVSNLRYPADDTPQVDIRYNYAEDRAAR